MNGCVKAISYFEVITSDMSPRETLKAAVNFVTSEVKRVTGVEFRASRINDIWSQEARRIEWWEMDAFAQTAEARKKIQDDTRDEIAAVYDRLAAVEAYLARVDPEFHEPAREAQSSAMGLVGRILGRPSRLTRGGE